MKDEGKNFYCCYNKLLFFLTIRLWLVSHCLNIYGQRQRLQLELGYRFSFFFLSSFKWILAYQLYALKELQKLDNKHLYLNTVQWKDHTDIFLEVQYELQFTQNKTGQAFSLVGCAINRFIKIWCLPDDCFTDRWQKLQAYEAAHSCAQPKNDQLLSSWKSDSRTIVLTCSIE